MTSRRILPTALLLAVGFSLQGCLDASLFGGDGETLAPRAVTLAGSNVTLRGPNGYCVDPASIQQNSGTSFALLGACSSIANTSRAASPPEKAVLSVAISDTVELELESAAADLQEFLVSDAGRATLARDGDPASVDIDKVGFQDGIVIINAHDKTPLPGQAFQNSYWRGFFNLGGRLATISVYARSGDALDDGRAQALLSAFARSLRLANSA